MPQLLGICLSKLLISRRQSKTQRRQGCGQSHTACSCPSLVWCLGFLIPSPGLLKSPPGLACVPALGWLNPEFLHYALNGLIAKSMKPLLSGDWGGERARAGWDWCPTSLVGGDCTLTILLFAWPSHRSWQRNCTSRLHSTIPMPTISQRWPLPSPPSRVYVVSGPLRKL